MNIYHNVILDLLPDGTADMLGSNQCVRTLRHPPILQISLQLLELGCGAVEMPDKNGEFKITTDSN